MNFFRLDARFFIVFTLITLLPAVWLATIIEQIVATIVAGSVFESIVRLGVIETPTTVAIIGAVFWVYENFLWKIWPFKNIHRVPSIAGRYVGELESSFGNGTKEKVVLEIKQSLLMTSVYLYTQQSSSHSILTGLGRNENENLSLVYLYKNKPRTVTNSLDMRMHDGVTHLEFFPKEKRIEGYYYNDPRERGKHGKISARFLSKNILGHF